MNLAGPIHDNAERLGDSRVAIVSDSETLGFATFWSRATSVRRELTRAGVRAGDRVMVWMPEDAPQTAVHIGAVSGGMLAVVLPFDSGRREIEHVLGDCRPRSIVANVDKFRELGLACPPGVALLEGGHIWRSHDDAAEAPVDVPDTHGATVYYSYYLGDGRSYGAVLTHGNHRFAAGYCARFHEIGWGSRVLVTLPLAHVYALGVAILPCLYGAGTLYVRRLLRPRHILDCIGADRITHFLAVPELLTLLADFYVPEVHDLGTMHHIVSGADFLPREVNERVAAVLGVPVVQGWGMSECFPAVCNPPDHRNRPGTLGIADDPGIELRIVDERGLPLERGHIGEIQVKSPAVMAGYLDAPEASARVLQEGWLRTGDLGYEDGEGYLCFHALAKPVINVRGNMVDPVEVARTIERCPGVVAAVVRAEAADRNGLRHTTLAADVDVREESGLSAMDIRAFCRLWLANYKIPKTVGLRPVRRADNRQ